MKKLIVTFFVFFGVGTIHCMDCGMGESTELLKRYPNFYAYQQYLARTFNGENALKIAKFTDAIYKKMSPTSMQILEKLYPNGASVMVVLSLLETDFSVFNILVASGMNPNCVNIQGVSTLMIACKADDMRVVTKLLWTPGIDVNAQDCEGKAALMYAASGKNDNPEIIKLLITANADTTLNDTELETAFTHAHKQKKFKQAEVLSQAQAQQEHVRLWHEMQEIKKLKDKVA